MAVTTALYLTIHRHLPYGRLWCILPLRLVQLDALPRKVDYSAVLHMPVMLVIFLLGVCMRTLFTALAFLIILMAVMPAVKRSLNPQRTSSPYDRNNDED